MTTLAFASLFPRLALSNAGWLWGLVFQAGIAGIYFCCQYLFYLVNTLHISMRQLCFGWIVMNSMLTLLAYLVALQGLYRMRNRDLDLDAAKRSS